MHVIVLGFGAGNYFSAQIEEIHMHMESLFQLE